MASAMTTKIATVSAVVVRLCGYIFLRWGQQPLLPFAIWASFIIYVLAAVYAYLHEPEYQLVDEIDIVVTETAVVPEDADPADAPIVKEQIDMQERFVVEQKPLNLLRSLLKGAPNPRSLAATIANVVINALIAAMAADLVFRGRFWHPSDDLSFVRVGYVSDTEAKLLIREPDQAKMPVTVELHIKEPVAPFDNPLWQTVGGVRWTSNETDYTAVVTVPIRHSQQRTWQWRTSNHHSGEFTSAPKPGHTPRSGPFTFLSTSCILPRLPYNPLDHALAIPGLRHLGSVLPKLNAQFMLFLGDFIYVDVPRRWGKQAENYSREYRQVYASPDWPAVGQNLSWIHVLDDHEIANDWDRNTTGLYRAAIEPWQHYQAAANPPPVALTSQQKHDLAAEAERGGDDRVRYFCFTQGPASFFMLDTRGHRSRNSQKPVDAPGKTMLGEAQLSALKAWLAKPEPRGVRWKFVASSVPLTRNWPFNTKDTWGGFLAERRQVLEAMWDAGAKGYGVVVLSGDRHEFAATKFPPPQDDIDSGRWPASAAVHEFSVSPLSQFYSPIGSYRQADAGDVPLKYIHSGNSKFGAIEIENLAEGDQSSLKYRLFVDGEEAWNTVILADDQPTASTSTAGNLLKRLGLGGA